MNKLTIPSCFSLLASPLWTWASKIFMQGGKKRTEEYRVNNYKQPPRRNIQHFHSRFFGGSMWYVLLKNCEHMICLGFPGGSDSKESACNAGNLGLTPGLGRSPGKGKDYPFQYSGLENSMQSMGLQSQTRLRDLQFTSHRDSLVAQRVKRLPPMWETWVRFLGRDDPLEKEMAAHSSILAWRIP